MPTGGSRRGSRGDALVDTSIAIALLVADHEHHPGTIAAVGRRRLGLSGHAAFEAYSVLTRLPAPVRRPPHVVTELLEANFPETRFLSSTRASRLLSEVAEAGIAGGAAYDALVGATAVEHGMVLVTRDHRAVETYRALGVTVEVLDP